MFAATFLYASHTDCLGIQKGLSCWPGMFLVFLPGLARLIEATLLDEPAPWLRPHPSEQGFHGYYGPVRRRTPHRYSLPSVSATAGSLSSAGWLCKPK